MRVTCQKAIMGKDEREPVLKATWLPGPGISHNRIHLQGENHNDRATQTWLIENWILSPKFKAQ
jgi:hypothetical protein